MRKRSIQRWILGLYGRNIKTTVTIHLTSPPKSVSLDLTYLFILNLTIFGLLYLLGRSVFQASSLCDVDRAMASNSSSWKAVVLKHFVHAAHLGYSFFAAD
jgi:hypothetical protein